MRRIEFDEFCIHPLARICASSGAWEVMRYVRLLIMVRNAASPSRNFRVRALFGLWLAGKNRWLNIRRNRRRRRNAGKRRRIVTPGMQTIRGEWVGMLVGDNLHHRWNHVPRNRLRQRSRMVPAALHRRLEGNSRAHHTQHIRVSFMNGLAGHAGLAHRSAPKFSLHADHVKPEQLRISPYHRRTRGPRSWTRIAIREFDEVQVVLNHIVAVWVKYRQVAAGRLACDRRTEWQRLGLEVLFGRPS